MRTFSVRVKIKVELCRKLTSICRRSRNSGPVLRFGLNEAEGSLRLSGRMRFFEFVGRL